jgi:hypothetical protein
MGDNPLARIPSFDRVSLRAAVVPDGVDPGPALAAAGIFDPIALPIVFGENPPDRSFGDGFTPNVAAVLEYDQPAAGDSRFGSEGRGSGFNGDPALAGVESGAPGSASDDAQPACPPTISLPTAYGMQPLAPVRASADGPQHRDRASVLPPNPAAKQRGPLASGFAANTGLHNPANISRFFDRLDAPLTRLANDLGLPERYLSGLSAYESKYYNDHNSTLNNPFGLTKAGGDNIRFRSVDEAMLYWKTQYGDQVRGATSAQDFAQRLEGMLNGATVAGWHRYNSVNSKWENEVTATINSIENRRKIWQTDR